MRTYPTLPHVTVTLSGELLYSDYQTRPLNDGPCNCENCKEQRRAWLMDSQTKLKDRYHP